MPVTEVMTHVDHLVTALDSASLEEANAILIECKKGKVCSSLHDATRRPTALPVYSSSRVASRVRTDGGGRVCAAAHRQYSGRADGHDLTF